MRLFDARTVTRIRRKNDILVEKTLFPCFAKNKKNNVDCQNILVRFF